MLTFLLALILPQQPCAALPDSAQVFAPHLADSARIFRGTFSADGKTLYYFRKRDLAKEDYQIMVSSWNGSTWSEGKRLDLGGDFSDLYPSVSPDGKRLVFSSYRRAPGDTAREPNAYLWYADRAGSRWGEPHFVGAASQFGSYHSGPRIQSDYSIQFSRTSPDWKTTEVVITRWNGKAYGPAELAEGRDLRAEWKDWRPREYYVWGGQLLQDGKAALLDISPLNEKGRRGPAQMYVSLRRGEDWSEPVLAGGGVNGKGWANFAVLRPDGCSILFVRDFTRFEIAALDPMLRPARGSPGRQR